MSNDNDRSGEKLPYPKGQARTCKTSGKHTVRPDFSTMSAADHVKIVHELETHQIELAMQNDELQAAHDDLRKMHYRYSRLYDAAPIGYLTQNQQGVIVRANQTFAKMLGLPALSLVDKTLSTFIVEEDRDQLYHHLERIPESPTAVSCELRLKNGNGEVFWAQLDSIRNKQDDFEPEMIQSVLIDVSDRKNNEVAHAQLQNQLFQSQKMHAIGELSGGIAHEFNNLLTPILGFLELLLQTKQENDTDIERLLMIRNAATRAAELVQQILTYTRTTPSGHEPMDVAACVASVIKLISHTIPSSVAISTQIEENVPPILGSLGKIHQVILNLCINASQAMPEGGDLAVNVTGPADTELGEEGQQLHKVQCLKIMVQDSGSGMEARLLERIFDPFFTTKSIGMGTGLGLSVVKGIVTQHGGKIEVQSQPGRGSTFTVYLPVVQMAVVETITDKRLVTVGHQRLLLVDDDQMVLSVTALMLENLGYVVSAYSNPRIALARFTTHAHEYDLLVTDYEMPTMNGMQLTHLMKQIRPNMPAMLITGYADRISSDDLGPTGLDRVLYKPFTLAELGEAVAAVFDCSLPREYGSELMPCTTTRASSTTRDLPEIQSEVLKQPELKRHP